MPRLFAETMRAFEKTINNNRITITAADDASGSFRKDTVMIMVSSRNISGTHQPRRKKGEERTVQGNPAK
jgi:hypothetical protein